MLRRFILFHLILTPVVILLKAIYVHGCKAGVLELFASSATDANVSEVNSVHAGTFTHSEY
jgi:hypothetical protein